MDAQTPQPSAPRQDHPQSSNKDVTSATATTSVEERTSAANGGGGGAAVGGGDDEAADDDMVDEDEMEMEEEQLEEYRETLDQLGNFADKVTINSLSMVAEDHAQSPQSAAALYGCIRTPLISTTVAADRKLPLVYVVDSILKNVKGAFVSIIEADAENWMRPVYDVLGEEQRMKLRKVWNTWKEFGIFKEESWKKMGQRFLEEDEKVKTKKIVADAKAKAAGIARGPDGSLQVSPPLRKHMQTLLDEAQSTGIDELDKVSLERLADINPDLLVEIKKAAQEILDSERQGGPGGGGSSVQGGSGGGGSVHSRFAETRSPEVMARSAEWAKLDLNFLEESNTLIHSLQHFVIKGASVPSGPDPPPSSTGDTATMTNLLAAASASATHLTNMLQRLKDQEADKENIVPKSSSSFPGGSGVNFGGGAAGASATKRYMKVDTSLFTNDGIKVKNDNVISALYEAGLPFVSSSDGRRFATQIALSKHLDELFRRREVEKTMERTEERGWYLSDLSWSGQGTDLAGGADADASAGDGPSVPEEELNPLSSTVPADESRDKCAICGINFKMFFDHEDGEYKYNNCREIDVLNDDAAEEESEAMLVHMTCLRGLGSPDFLTMDQVLQVH